MSVKSSGTPYSRRDVLTGTIGLGILAGANSVTNARSEQKAPARIRSDIKMLVFDTFGTVVDWRGTIIAEGQRLSKAKGLKIDWAAFADAWRAEYVPSMNRVRRGEIPWTNLDSLHRMSLDLLLLKFRIDQLSAAEIAELNKVWHRCRPWPDSVPGLTRLRTHYLVAPLSNGNISLLTEMAKTGGLPWDCILGAELVQHYKPDPEVYLSPAKFFDLAPAEVMMVAAHQVDLRVPKELGIRTAYIHRPYEGGSAGGGAMPAKGTYDYIVNSLRELASALGT